MSKPKKQKEHQALPSVKGTMQCEKGHRWDVRELNPERVIVPCPVCGGQTSIKTGFLNGR